MSDETDRSTWTLEQLIDHACSLAMGYGAGRDDQKVEFMATKAEAMARAAALEVNVGADDPMIVHALSDERMKAICEGRSFNYNEVFGMSGAWLRTYRALHRASPR